MDKEQDKRNNEETSFDFLEEEEEEEYESSWLKSFIKKGVVILVVCVLLTNLLSIWPVIINLPAMHFLKTSYKLSNNKTIEQVKGAVVSVKAGNKTGTGFNVTSQGLVITNYHVIEGMDHLYVHFQNGDLYEPVKVITYPEVDLAVLKLTGNSLPHVEINFEVQPLEKEHVYFVGNPLGFPRVANEGTVEGTIVVDSIGEPVLMVDAPVYQGNSGSPLVNKEGEVIGIIFATLPKEGSREKSFGLAIPAIYLKERLENEIK